MRETFWKFCMKCPSTLRGKSAYVDANACCANIHPLIGRWNLNASSVPLDGVHPRRASWRRAGSKKRRQYCEEERLREDSRRHHWCGELRVLTRARRAVLPERDRRAVRAGIDAR